MTGWLVVTVLLLTSVAAAWTVVMIVRDESPPSDRFFVVLGVLLLVLVVQLVAGLVALATTDRDVDGVTFVAYLLTVVLAPPFGAALALVERSRWGTASLLVALATVAAMEVRLDALWAAAGA
ncbi:hypothetical protein [uncultured Nocardioides sp.]|uniref:hypothetical protein n=1 Tax=uncultured Nocardioides sp. TaxID=198441 RepID=UPI002630C106|nr:hypothetical protein [uncultured Nocardioides sp.]